MAIHPDLLDLIRCPKCRGELILAASGDGFTCKACKVVYPIVDDIPQLLVEEARPISASTG